MIKTIGDYWRECDNEGLASNMVDFFASLLVNAGVDADDIDLVEEYKVMLNFFNTEYESEEEVKPTSNGFSYIN